MKILSYIAKSGGFGNENMLYLYIVKCSDGRLYTGVTNNIDKRLFQHNQGVHKKAYTYSRRPVKLLFHKEFKNKFDAISAEKQVKGWSRKKKLALINGDFKSIKKLAECKNTTNYRNRKTTG